jgi:hypothetical protein
MEINMSNEANEKIRLLLELIKTDSAAALESGQSLKKKTKRMKILLITLSALITAILGLGFGDTGKNIAIVLSAMLTGFSTWDSFANYEKRLFQETTSINEFTMLCKEIDLYLVGNDSLKLEKFEEFKSRYNNIHEDYFKERKSLKNPEKSGSDIKKD